jgi:4-amino-4-deoxy-L-arabinose transferase-like glycosyltransferase
VLLRFFMSTRRPIEPPIKKTTLQGQKVSPAGNKTETASAAAVTGWQEADWRLLLMLLALTALLFWLGLGHYPLLDVDEPRYPQSVREMMKMGQYITPYFNGQLRLDKPILFYWGELLAFMSLGVSFFAARLPSALAGSLTVGTMFAVPRLAGLLNGRQAFLLAAMGATCLEVIALARFSTPDMLLAFCMLATWATLTLLVLQKNNKWWLLAGVFAALGTLTKGPVALVLPGLHVMGLSLLAGRFKTTFLNRYFPLALLLWAGLTAPWFILGGLQNGKVFWEALYFHNVVRYKDVVSGHNQPWFFYGLVALLGSVPYTPLLALLGKAKTLWQQLPLLNALPKTAPTESASSRFALAPLQLLFVSAVGWSLAVLGFYSMAQSKLLTYVLPMFPTLAFALGLAVLALQHLLQSQPEKKTPFIWKGFVGLYGLLALLMCGVGWLFLSHADFMFPKIAQEVAFIPLDLALPTLLGSFGFLVVAWLWAKKRLFASLAVQVGLVAVLAPLIVLTIIPKVAEAILSQLSSLAPIINKQPVAFYKTFRPSMVYTLNRPIAELHTEAEALAFWKQNAAVARSLQQPGCVYWIARNSEAPELLKLAQKNKLPVKLRQMAGGKRYKLVGFCQTGAKASVPQESAFAAKAMTALILEP